MAKVICIVIWVLLLGAVGVVFLNKNKGKKKYKNVKFKTDSKWMENSIAAYPDDTERKKYFFHYDKEYMHQGHIVEDEQHQKVYEIKVLYNNGLQADETDFVNHILQTTTHHTIGKTVTTDFDGDRSGITLNSAFKFDGENIFDYLHGKGYDYKFCITGIAYHIDILKGGEIVAKIYSSNNGKNLYERTTSDVIEKAGGKGLYVLECAYRDFDATVLYALAFTRTEFDLKQMMHYSI